MRKKKKEKIIGEGGERTRGKELSQNDKGGVGVQEITGRPQGRGKTNGGKWIQTKESVTW